MGNFKTLDCSVKKFNFKIFECNFVCIKINICNSIKVNKFKQILLFIY